MTKFNREDFNYHGGYLTYGSDRKFVARFKYAARDKARFVTFLIKNFSVEEYFAAREAADPTNAYGNPAGPATILAAKGYVSTTSRKQMKDKGYTTFTTATYRDYMEKHIFSSSEGNSEYWANQDEKHAAILAACAAA